MAALPDIPEVELNEESGRGGFGVLYKGTHAGRIVAVKVQKADSVSDLESRIWNREAAALARLRHPSLVRVLHVGKTGERAYLVMEFAEGETLAGILRRGPMPEERIVAIMIRLAGALSEVHRHGLIHRDIKPSNIIVGMEDQPKLIDFGLASNINDATGGRDTFVGSVDYCPPEQTPFIERQPDARSDLYALGCVMYECATGRRPFSADDPGELLRQHATVKAPLANALKPEISPALTAIIERLLSKDMDDRYQSAVSLLTDLTKIDSLNSRFSTGEVAELTLDKGQVQDLPMTGRQTELDALKRVWSRVTEGKGGLVVVEGEPGAGKSHLIRSLLTDIESPETAVLRGKCVKGEVIAFSLLKAVIETFLREIQKLPHATAELARTKVTNAARRDASILKRFSPGLGQLLANAPDCDDLDEKFDQFPAAVSGFFVALAKEFGNLAFFIDDLQWIDPASRQVLKHLSEEISDAPVMVICTVRSGDAGEEAVDDLIADVQKNLAVRFKLNPLNPAEVRQMIMQLLGSEAVDEKLYSLITIRCNGNPFAIREYVRAMLDHGLLNFVWGAWQVGADGLGTISLPEDVFDLVLQRIEALGPGTKDILVIAAVLGTRFDASLLARAAGLPQKTIDVAVRDAVKASIVERADGSIYEFAHDRIRESLLRPIRPERLAEIHQQIAEALDADKDDSDTHIFSLAHHYLKGIPAKSQLRRLEITALAGKRALDACANAEAWNLLQQARSLGQEYNRELSWETYESLGEVCRRLSKIEEGTGYLHIALESAPSAMARSRIMILIAYSYLTILDADRAWVHVKRAYLQLGHRAFSSHPLAVAFNAARGVFGFFCMLTGLFYGRAGVGADRIRRLMKLAQLSGVVGYYRLDALVTFQASMWSLLPAWKLGFSKELALAYYGLGTVLSFAGLAKASRYYFGKASRVAERMSDPMLLAECKLYEAYSINFAGRSIEAAQAMTKVLTDYGRWLDANNFSSGTADLSENLLFRGYFQESAKWTENLIAYVEAHRSSDVNSPQMMTYYAKAAMQQAVFGSVADAAKSLQKAAKIATVYQMPMATGIYATISILYHLEIGELGPIDRLIAERMAVVPRDPGAPLLLQRYFYIAQGYARFAQYLEAEAGSKDAALAKFSTAVSELRRCRRHATFRPHYHVLSAALLWAKGQDRKAFRELSKADLAANEFDSPWVHFETGKLRARILSSRGNRDSATRHIKSAIAMALDHGWESRARALAEEYGIEHRRPNSTLSTSRTATMSSMRTVKAERYLDVLVKTGQAASGVLDPARQSQLALDQIIRTLNAERGYLLTVSPDTGALEVVCARDDEQRDIAESTGFSTLAVRRVAEDRKAFVLTGTSQGAELGSASIVAHDLRSVLAAPLMLGEEFRGVIYLDSRLAKGIFSEADIGMISAIASQIVLVMETARMASVEIERRSLERDLEVSGTVQSFLLPKEKEILTDQFHLSSSHESASQSGGDWWWVDNRADGSMLLIVGDVTGHGVGAAMVAAAVAGSYRSLQAMQGNEPGSISVDSIFRSMNESLSDFCRGEYLMSFLGVEVFTDGRLVFWYGGAPHPMVLSSSGALKKIQGAGNPLGMDPYIVKRVESRLERGDKLLVYTDGVTEVRSPAGRMLRSFGLAEILKKTASMSAPETVAFVKESMDTFRTAGPLEDDATIIVLKRL